MRTDERDSLSPYQLVILDELLSHRAELPAETAPAQPHPHRSRSSRPNPGNRRLVLGAASAVVAGGVLVGVAALGGFQPDNHHAGRSRPGHVVTPDLETVAYRTTAALDQVSGTDIEHIHDVQTNSAGTVMSSTDVWRYEGSWRIETFGAGGSPQLDDSNSASNGTTTGRVVNYAGRSWFATSQRSPAPLVCDLVCETRRNVADGFFNVVVKTTLNGRPELQLARTSSPGGSPSYMLWVDPATYLPVQSVTTLENGRTSKTTFTWLTPDAASLAHLVAPIPAGFTQLSGPPQEPAPADGGVG